jgi:nuclear transport factor 2 (NTF2) superfamily protein
MNPPRPPFTAETAAEKTRRAEDAWNTRDPTRVVLAYTSDSRWRNRAEFLEGRDAIKAFLTRKWQRELDYRLIKEVWAFRENRIAVRFAYEPYALPMNGTTTAATGSAATATRTGNSTSMA